MANSTDSAGDSGFVAPPVDPKDICVRVSDPNANDSAVVEFLRGVGDGARDVANIASRVGGKVGGVCGWATRGGANLVANGASGVWNAGKFVFGSSVDENGELTASGHSRMHRAVVGARVYSDIASGADKVSALIPVLGPTASLAVATGFSVYAGAPVSTFIKNGARCVAWTVSSTIGGCLSPVLLWPAAEAGFGPNQSYAKGLRGARDGRVQDMIQDGLSDCGQNYVQSMLEAHLSRKERVARSSSGAVGPNSSTVLSHGGRLVDGALARIGNMNPKHRAGLADLIGKAGAATVKALLSSLIGSPGGDGKKSGH